MNDFMFRMPTKVMFGVGALRKVPGLCREQGYSRIFVVTGSTSTSKSPQLQELLAELAALSIATQVFSEVEADPSIETVDRGAAALGAFGADAVIAFGGGSPMDAAKSMSLVSANGGSIADYMRAKKAFVQRGVPLICVPTTAGTGSEVTASAVTTDKATKEKIGIGHDFQMPAYAVIDPLVQVSMPPAVTAATGMDALTHAIESVVNPSGNPVSVAVGLQSIRMIKENLPRVVADGADLVARQNMLAASTLAGIALGPGLGIAHCLAHTVGTLFGIHHGTGCGIALPAAMRFNRDHATARLGEVALAMGVNTRDMSPGDAADAAAEAVEALMKAIGQPLRVSELIPMDKIMASFEQIVAGTMGDGSTMFNPRPVNDPAAVAAFIQSAI